MRLLDRLIRVLTAVLLLAVSAAMCAVWFFGWDLPGLMNGFRANSDPGWAILAGVGAALCGALALLDIFFPGILLKRDKGYVVQKMADDRISVSRDVVEELAMACIREHKELEKPKLSARSHRDGVDINISCRLRSGTDLTRSIDYIQRQIRRHVTDTTGLKVHHVALRVEALTGKPLPIPDVPTHEEPEILDAGERPGRKVKDARKRRDSRTDDEPEPAAAIGDGSSDTKEIIPAVNDPKGASND